MGEEKKGEKKRAKEKGFSNSPFIQKSSKPTIK
jgi:hypothetical protein